MFEELKTQSVKEALSTLSRYKTNITLVGLLVWGVAFIFDKWIDAGIIITLFKLGGFLLFIGSFMSKSKKK